MWGSAHVFEGQLYRPRDIVESSVLQDYSKPPPSPPKLVAKNIPTQKGQEKEGGGAYPALLGAPQEGHRLLLRGRGAGTLLPATPGFGTVGTFVLVECCSFCC